VTATTGGRVLLRASVLPLRLLDPFDQREDAPAEWHRRLVTLGAAVFVAALALVSIVVVGGRVGGPSIERHLRLDIDRSVLVDNPDVRAVVNGRTVSLSGSVPDRAERDRVIRRVAARWGVAEVRADALKITARKVGTTTPPRPPRPPTSAPTRTPATSV
jgi:hypothetical protein